MALALLWSCRAVPEPAPPVAPPAEVGVAARYRISFPEAARHRVTVEATVRCPDAGALELWMPSWTPGSYTLRDYARLVGDVRVGDQRLAPIAKDRWRGTCAPGSSVTAGYTIYAWPGSVREDRVEPDLALLQGAATFLLPEETGRYEVSLDLPTGWTAHTALPSTPDGFEAPDLDTLVDSPFALGAATVTPFAVRGVPHELVVFGAPEGFDAARVAADAARAGEALAALWGGVPYDRYQLLVWLREGSSGGLEHRSSAMLALPAPKTDEDYVTLAGLAAHELGHAWDGKRLRPRGLGPFDYTREVYTPSLWLVEGLDSYVAELALARSGVREEPQTLASLSATIRELQSTPGRRVQSLRDASVRAWVGEYKRDADSVDRTVGYYPKGAVVAWLLDAEIRRATDDRASLDDWLRLAWARIGDAPYDEDQLRALASEVAGRDLGPFFARAVDGVDELDYGGALQWFGLRFAAPTGGPELGARVTDDGRVLEVRDGTAAAAAGLSVDDRIEAIAGRPVERGRLDEQVAALGARWTGPVRVVRAGAARELTVTLGPPEPSWSLEPDPGAAPLAALHRRRWLGSR